LGLSALLGIAATVSIVADLGLVRQMMTASLRAALQLAVVALALRGVFDAPVTAVAVLAVMFSVAIWTATRRLAGVPDARQAVLLGCGVGAGVAVTIVVALPTLDRDVRTLIAVAGIVIGNSMVAATLAGRHLYRGLRQHRDEVEGWLAIGATPRQAVRGIARDAAREAMVPGMDQTRTTGLVTLPGAFIGALLGGASPLQAARFQIVVLVALLCAQVLTAATVTYRLGAPATIPADS